MKEVLLSDWTLDAVKQREEKRRRKEEADAALVACKQRGENHHTEEGRLSNWTLLEALKKREEERRKNEEAEASLVAATPGKITDLRNQLKAIAAERDRNAYEKIEIVPKANKVIKERDNLRAEFEIASAERDRQAVEKSQAIAKVDGSVKECAELRETLEALSAERDRLLAEKADIERAAETARAETLRLRHQIDSAPQIDPAKMLFEFAAERVKVLIAKSRGMIPSNSLALRWFDKTMAIIIEVGCFGVEATRALVRWAIPRLRKLYAFVQSEVKTRQGLRQ